MGRTTDDEMNDLQREVAARLDTSDKKLYDAIMELLTGVPAHLVLCHLRIFCQQRKTCTDIISDKP